MRIAQVAPLYESVPPKLYGGTERVVSYLTEELVRQGHDVTLFASGDSTTAAKLISPCSRSLRLDGGSVDPLSYHLMLVDQVFERTDDFDVIHFHTDYLSFPVSRWRPAPHVTTLHGRLDLQNLPSLYRRFRREPVISISDAQRSPLPWLNWQGTVHHGIPTDLHAFHPRSGDYLAFVGRISPEKRLDRAIEIAVRCGRTLKIAAKVDAADQKYFEEVIRPLLGQPGVEFIGEIGEREKDDLMGNACALLFPIDWPEPFGLVMIESMACGTPVVAWRAGSVPEVITEGITGVICESVEEAAQAVEGISQIDRTGCRQVFENRFSADRMAKEYVKIYEQIIAKTPQEEVLQNGRDHSGPGAVLHPGNIVTH